MDTREYAADHILIEERGDGLFELILSLRVTERDTGIPVQGTYFTLETYRDKEDAQKLKIQLENWMDHILRFALSKAVRGTLYCRDVVGEDLGQRLRAAVGKQCATCVFWTSFQDDTRHGCCAALSGKVPESPTSLKHWLSDSNGVHRITTPDSLLSCVVTESDFWCPQHQRPQEPDHQAD